MGNELSTEERMMRLETKLEHIEAFLIRLETKLDARDHDTVRMDVLDEKLKLRDEKIAGLQNALNNIRDEKQSNKAVLPNWLQSGLGLLALVVSVLAIIYK